MNDTGGLGADGPGIGAYDAERGRQRMEERARASGAAPFGCSAVRKGPADTHASAAPGPGFYGAPGAGGALLRLALPSCASAFKSKTKRLQGDRTASSTPGPGAYGSSAGSAASARAALAPSGARQGSKAPLAAAPTVPSIPAGDHALGYERDSEGRVVPRRTNAGPCSPEAPAHRDWGADSARRGIAFDKQSSRQGASWGAAPRRAGAGASGTGSGADAGAGAEGLLSGRNRSAAFVLACEEAANAETAAAAEAERIKRMVQVFNPALVAHLRPKQHSAFASRSERLAAARKDAAETPGPGYYVSYVGADRAGAGAPPGASAGAGAGAGAGGAGRTRSGTFGSTVERFAEPKRSGDTPTFYFAGESSFADTWKRPSAGQQVQQQRSAFSSSSARLPLRRAEIEAPPVGSYSIPGLAEEIKLKLAMVPHAGKQSFGTTASRFCDPAFGLPARAETAPLPEVEAPAPAPATAPAGGGAASAFRSRTARGVDAAPRPCAPPIGTYETARFGSIAATVAAKSGKGIMLSTTGRSGDARCEDSSAQIGPGYYDTGKTTFVVKRASRKAVLGSAAERFTVAPELVWSSLVPGPGHYAGVDGYDTGLMRPTYNLSVAVEEERALQRKGLL